MIQYYDTITDKRFIDVATLMSLLKKNKAETHRIIRLFRIDKINYKNRYLLSYSAVEEILKGFNPVK